MPTRIGILSTWNTRCGIAEYSRHLVEALRRHDDVEVTVLSSRNFGERATAPYEDWAKPAFDVQKWHPDYKFDLDVEMILEQELDVLHVQYSTLFYDRGRLLELLQRFPGVTALTYHDKGGTLVFPHELLDLLYAHREDVGIGPRHFIPQGIELHRPVVKTFGLGRSRIDIIGEVCERNDWDFQHSFGEDRWLDSHELFEWLRDSDAIVLWYDDDPLAGGSAGAPLRLAPAAPCSSTTPSGFATCPSTPPTCTSATPRRIFETAMREVFADPYAEERTWDSVASTLLADYRGVLDEAPRTCPGRPTRCAAGRSWRSTTSRCGARCG